MTKQIKLKILFFITSRNCVKLCRKFLRGVSTKLNLLSLFIIVYLLLLFTINTKLQSENLSRNLFEGDFLGLLKTVTTIDNYRFSTHLHEPAF